MTVHELKIDAKAFDASTRGDKLFEIRFNDRNFEVGDELWLRETLHTEDEMKINEMPLIYTGRELTVKVNYILSGPIYGLAEGWVIMS